MRASLETQQGVIRVHPGDDDGYGAPYDWACSVTFTQAGEAQLSGVDKPVTPQICKAIRALLRDHGVREVVFERLRPGRAPRFGRMPIA